MCGSRKALYRVGTKLKPMNYRLLICSLLSTSMLVGQNFQTTIDRGSADFNHYSIEYNGEIEDLVLAGTIFDSGDQDIHVIRMDATGNIACEQIVDLSSDDRALDVAIVNGEIAITGYTLVNGHEQLIVATFDYNTCACQDMTVLTTFIHSAGTNIISANQGESIIVGGTISEDPFAFPLTNSRALVLKLDQNLSFVNANEFFGPQLEHASVNDIVEIPEGFFVTGSIDYGIQSVMAITLDDNLSLASNISFEASNSEHVGVSAVYFESDDQVFLMSNNSVTHNPEITVIDNVTSGPSISNHYVLGLDPQLGVTNAAGFELMKGNYQDDALVAAGYFRTYTIPGSTDNATPWLAAFNKNDGTNYQTLIYEAPSTNFHTHGGGVFSTFSGEHPYIFNQEILAERPDGKGYVFAGPRLAGGDYRLDVVSTDWIATKNSCLTSLTYDSEETEQVLVPIHENPLQCDFDGIGGNCASLPSNQTTLCTVIAKRGESADASTALTSQMSIYPNPADAEFDVVISELTESGELVVSNTLGETVFSSQVQPSGEAIRIDLGDYQSGIYFVVFTNDSQKLVSKVLKH